MNEQDRQLKKGNNLLAVGSRQLEWGYAEVALKSLKKALIIFQDIGDFQGEVKTLDKLGEIYLQSNQLNQALECYKKSLNLNQEKHNNLGISKSFTGLGLVYQSLKDFPEAIECYQKGLTITLAENEREQAIKVLSHLGESHRILGDYNNAVNFYQQGLLISLEIKNLKWELIFLDALGETSADVGNYHNAIQYHERCLFLSKNRSDQDKQITFMGCLGNHHSELEDYEKSIQYYRECISIASNIRHKRFEILANRKPSHSEKVLNHYQHQLNLARQAKDIEAEKFCLEKLGIIYEAFGEYTKLINCYEQRLKIAEINEDNSEKALILFHLFSINSYSKNYAKAVDYNYRGLKILWSSPIPILFRLLVGTGLVIFKFLKLIASFDPSAIRLGKIAYFLALPASLGDMHLTTKNYARAIHYYEELIKRSRKINDLQMEALALAKLGEVYRFAREFHKAVEYYEEGIILNKKIDKLEFQASILAALASVYFEVDDYDKAVEYFEQSILFARKFEDLSTETKCLMYLGNIFLSLNKYSEAIGYFENALEIAKKHHFKNEIVGLLVNLHNCHVIVGNDEKSIAHGQEILKYARQVKNYFLLAAILGNIGSAFLRKGNIKQANDNLQESLIIAQKNKDTLHETLSLSNLGLIQLKENNLIQSEHLVRSAIKVSESVISKIDHSDIYDDLYKIHLLEQQLLPYYLLQKILTKQSEFESALEISEHSRARAITNLLIFRLSSKNLTSQFESARISLNYIKRIAKKLAITIVEYSIIPTDNLIANQLDITEESELLIWVITPSGKVDFRQICFKSLQAQGLSLSELVREARSSLIKKDSIGDSAISSLETLYHFLIEPIENLLPKNTNAPVVFVPHKRLFLVPFSALRDAISQKFLIEKHSISIITSIQMLDLIDKQRKNFKNEKTSYEKNSLSALIVGNPKMPTIPLTEPPVQLQDLAWSKTEADAIAHLLNTQAITGSDATKDYITEQMSKARLIHLATHGLLDDIRQLGIPGAVALAPTDEDNGFLTAGEIYEMKLNAELVVLSACSTGQGKITGDGVVGLSRCLIAAGVKSVIVSLWSVGDLSTALMMVKFYQIFQQGVAAAIALNEAQRWLLGINKTELAVWVKTNEQFFDATLKMNLHRRLNQLDDSAKPFANPRHWAAFFAIGQ